jgi:hypothetical protein
MDKLETCPHGVRGDEGARARGNRVPKRKLCCCEKAAGRDYARRTDYAAGARQIRDGILRRRLGWGVG